jgi:hypothetical protein
MVPVGWTLRQVAGDTDRRRDEEVAVADAADEHEKHNQFLSLAATVPR